MAIISFYSCCENETGNTVSAVTYATFLGITKNKKTLLISTGVNDSTVADALWTTKTTMRSGLFGPNTGKSAQTNSIEDLDRVVRSNKTTSDIITDYTRVALRGRFEVLTSYMGNEAVFEEIQKSYPQIASLATKAYDNVIIDIDRKLNENIMQDLLNISDIIVATSAQNIKNIEGIHKKIHDDVLFSKDRTIMLIGKYFDNTRFNVKNISRNLLKQNEIINTMPFSPMILESIQEGKLIDIIITLTQLKNRDENSFLLDEIRRLNEKIENTLMEQHIRRQ